MKSIRLRQRLILSLSAFLLIGSAATLALRVRHLHQERTHPFGRLNAAQVLQLSQSLCQDIAPYEQTFNLSMLPVKGPCRNDWDIQCDNATGHEVVDLTWDANTGQLSQVGAFPPYQDEPAKPLLTKQEAVLTAYSWLLTLQGNAPSLHWRLARLPICADRRSWVVAFRSAGHHAYIQMQARSGNLLMAHFWQQPASPGNL